jgi:type I restriction enzyme S subunit
VPQSFLSNHVIPLPPIEEQKRIASRIQELLQEMDRARAACERQLEAMSSLPRAILKKALAGEL